MGGSKRAHNKRTNRSKLMSFMEDNPPHPHFSSLPPPPKFLRFRRHWIQPPTVENPAHAHAILPHKLFHTMHITLTPNSQILCCRVYV